MRCSLGEACPEFSCTAGNWPVLRDMHARCNIPRYAPLSLLSTALRNVYVA